MPSVRASVPMFFATPRQFRAWLRKNHDRADQLWVGFYRKDSGRRSITWRESVDEALCFGWIDNIRKRVDKTSYKIRFTPRRAKSTWSKVNIARVAALTLDGRMHEAGLAAFARREEQNSGTYSFENRKSAKLGGELESEFRRNSAAWRFYESQPPGYRRLAAWYVISAKRPETRRRRLQRLIQLSSSNQRLYG